MNFYIFFSTGHEGKLSKSVSCCEASRLKGKRNKQENLCLQVTNTITKCFFRSGESLGAQQPIEVLVV